MMHNKSDIISLLTKALDTERSVVVAYLFGSFVHGRTNAESDIDVALLFRDDALPDGLHLLDLATRLSCALTRDIDIVCLNTAGPVIAMQVLRKGERIVERDAKARVDFEAHVTGRYDDLKRMRRPIEQHVREGRIYG